MTLFDVVFWFTVSCALYGLASALTGSLTRVYDVCALFVIDLLLDFGQWLRDTGESLRQFARRRKFKL